MDILSMLADLHAQHGDAIAMHGGIVMACACVGIGIGLVYARMAHPRPWHQIMCVGLVTACTMIGAWSALHMMTSSGSLMATMHVSDLIEQSDTYQCIVHTPRHSPASPHEAVRVVIMEHGMDPVTISMPWHMASTLAPSATTSWMRSDS